jgi:large subunit ribosomal protein L15
MQLHQIKSKTKRIRHQDIGRGGKRGKTSGKGTKGQKSRSGHRMRPELRDIIKKLPKNRGYRFATIETKPAIVQVGSLEVFKNNTEVNPKVLVEQGLIKRVSGVIPKIKILANGELTKSVKVSDCQVSASAKAKILAAKGEIK